MPVMACGQGSNTQNLIQFYYILYLLKSNECFSPFNMRKKAPHLWFEYKVGKGGGYFGSDSSYKSKLELVRAATTACPHTPTIPSWSPQSLPPPPPTLLTVRHSSHSGSIPSWAQSTCKLQILPSLTTVKAAALALGHCCVTGQKAKLAWATCLQWNGARAIPDSKQWEGRGRGCGGGEQAGVRTVVGQRLWGTGAGQRLQGT